MSRRAIFISAVLSASCLAAPQLLGYSPRFIWNASASVPIGLYAVRPPLAIEVGDLVTVSPPPGLADFLNARGYLPRGVPLIKHVLALSGTEVCRLGSKVSAHGQIYGTARLRDREGRDLPAWRGCHVIAAEEVFLMNWNASDSFDGRYFGPLPFSTITGRLSPVWTDEEGNGRFEWWADTR